MRNQRLKIAIIESGEKGYEIARKLEWHPTKVSQIVIGAYAPSSVEKRQLAEVLGRSVHELFTNNPVERIHV
jgi:hypothetical protein